MRGNEELFPIVEAFGYLHNTDAAGAARSNKLCPFSKTSCEKFRQYKYGYCSVSYAAESDEGIRRTYAVCDHRLDGDPLRLAISDHFGGMSGVKLVPEVVLTKPRQSFDYVAIALKGTEIVDQIAIETQAIDIRGGGVGPAWRAWYEGKPHKWRDYFTTEATRKGRKDTVAYGVNMANIYKRLGMQVAEKGAFLKRIGIPFYILTQDLPFRYLQSRIPFEAVGKGKPWDIAFMTFDYSGKSAENGMLDFPHVQTVRTTVNDYTSALTKGTRFLDEKLHFLERVKRKAQLI